jgi:hypothetical protein
MQTPQGIHKTKIWCIRFQNDHVWDVRHELVYRSGGSDFLSTNLYEVIAEVGSRACMFMKKSQFQGVDTTESSISPGLKELSF